MIDVYVISYFIYYFSRNISINYERKNKIFEREWIFLY